MRLCKSCAGEIDRGQFCTSCGGAVSVALARGKDDLNRTISLYGRPDRDSAPEGAEPDDATTHRTLEYASAGILFTFMSEQAGKTAPRWHLMTITDLYSRYALTPYAAAKRLLQ